MGASYKAIYWNKSKKKYDLILWGFILSVLVAFSICSIITHPNISIETLIIRSTAVTAIILLHIILLVGPLCRIDVRFLPLLYNRRHMGVSMFILGLIHGLFAIIQFHSLGDKNPILSIFTSNQNYREISEFPFQILGFFALTILFAMAATSHDFWLKNLSPKIWKALHMMVYMAYGLIIAHVALGSLQYETHPIYWIFLIAGFMAVGGLHLYVGIKSIRALENEKELLEKEGYQNVGNISDIEEKCAKTISLNNQNIAIFKYDGKISAVHSQCKHQMGPLGEGKIIDGCITCPWHGYQYLPENGQSPPPFHEKVHTYRVKTIGQEVWINPDPLPEGTFVEAAKISDS